MSKIDEKVGTGHRKTGVETTRLVPKPFNNKGNLSILSTG